VDADSRFRGSAFSTGVAGVMLRSDRRPEGREMSDDTKLYRVATFTILLLVAVSLSVSLLFAVIGVFLG
jgi:hypothetical protein